MQSQAEVAQLKEQLKEAEGLAELHAREAENAERQLSNRDGQLSAAEQQVDGELQLGRLQVMD